MSSHTLPQVTVIDGPVTTRQSTVWVIVHVEDENDNPPTFPEITYRISLTERDRNKRGEQVYRVFAYDRDLGANGNITYSIVDGNEEDKFSIDPRSAMVSSKKMVTAGSYDILTVSVIFQVCFINTFLLKCYLVSTHYQHGKQKDTSIIFIHMVLLWIRL